MSEERLMYTIASLIALLTTTGLAYWAGFRHGQDVMRRRWRR